MKGGRERGFERERVGLDDIEGEIIIFSVNSNYERCGIHI
jgi:hypothetical protein